MKILLLSAYHAQSHKSWCASIMAMFPEHNWTLLSLAGRYFNWRIRGNALTWSITESEVLSSDYDCVLATSMVDCATLRGLNPNLAKIPWHVYFHENQFDYPVDVKHDHTEPKMVSLYNALCAEKVIFNSDYNYKTFISGLTTFLKKMPDGVPSNTIQLIEAKSRIIPVPIEMPTIKNKKNNKLPVLLWNHRWEYDKGPDRLLSVIKQLLQRKFEFKLNLIGQQFRTTPNEFLELKALLGDAIINYGYIETQKQYQDVLENSDIILSTALHDFQGLSVLEAVAFGCIPVVPLRLAYPEYFTEYYCYQSDLEQADNEAISMADKIIEISNSMKNINLDTINVSQFSGEALRIQYTDVLD